MCRFRLFVKSSALIHDLALSLREPSDLLSRVRRVGDLSPVCRPRQEL